jgi:hypothetical protein
LCSSFAQGYTNDVKNTTLLLDYLGEVDFHIRYDCLQLLGSLFKQSAKQVIEGILSNPVGVGKLMDMLKDYRDAIRTG